MQTKTLLTALTVALALAGCSKPQAGASDGKTFVADGQAPAIDPSATRAKPVEYSAATEGPVLDANGEPLDPELADAVRESVRERQEALGEAAEDVSEGQQAPAADEQ